MRLTSVASVKRGGGCGEVLLGLDAPVLQGVALGQRRQAAAVVVLGVVLLALAVRDAVVAAFLVEP